MGSGFFGYFLDVLFLLPLLILIRGIFPSALVFRLSLILAGIYLLYVQAPRFVPFFIIYWLVVWLLQYWAAWAGRIKCAVGERAALFVLVAVPILPMLTWKIWPAMFIQEINHASATLLWAAVPQVGFVDALVGLAVPLGLSFVTFRALDLLLKTYLGLLEPTTLDRTMYYGLFPPILALGPIAEYEEVRCDEIKSRWPLAGDLSVGLLRIALGAIKIFAIGIPLERAAAHFWAGGETPVPEAWLATMLYGLFFYANFSGFSEVAIGSTRVLGLRLKENFANPFLKTNPQAFWNAWHMSLTRWAQRYVFIPLGGMRPQRQYFATFAVIMTIALWHGIAMPLVVFGIYHGVIVVAHRYLLDRRRKTGRGVVKDGRIAKVLKPMLVFFYVSLSIPLLVLNSNQAIAFYAKLFLGLPIAAGG